MRTKPSCRCRRPRRHGPSRDPGCAARPRPLPPPSLVFQKDLRSQWESSEAQTGQWLPAGTSRAGGARRGGDKASGCSQGGLCSQQVRWAINTVRKVQDVYWKDTTHEKLNVTLEKQNHNAADSAHGGGVPAAALAHCSGSGRPGRRGPRTARPVPGGARQGLAVALPQLDGLVVLERGRGDDVLGGVAGCGDHHI